MPRPVDEPIPDAERLFHSVSADNVDGDRVLPEAVWIPDCSFSREKYGSPEAAFSETRPRETGLAWLTPGLLPGPFPRPGADPLEFVATDVPLEGDDAHSEVRLKRCGAEYNRNIKPPKALKAELLAALAGCMRVFRAPT
jgi:hypothetical protein